MWTFDGVNVANIHTNSLPYNRGEMFGRRFEYVQEIIEDSLASRRPEASWRRMLLSQPPLRELILDHGQVNHWHVLRPSCPLVGITMGDLYDSITAFGGRRSLHIQPAPIREGGLWRDR